MKIVFYLCVTAVLESSGNPQHLNVISMTITLTHFTGSETQKMCDSTKILLSQLDSAQMRPQVALYFN